MTQPRPASPHAVASSALGGELHAPFGRGRGGPGGWVLLDAPYFELPPDWACEVLSPSTRKVDRVDKLPIYARSGVSHAWFVDPLDRTLEVFRRDGLLWTLIAVQRDEAVVRAEPFDAVELELSALRSR